MILFFKHFIGSRRWLIAVNISLLFVIFALLVLWPNFNSRAQSVEGYIFPSATDQVRVSVNVLPNLSLSVISGQPKYATNNPYGLTLKVDESKPPIVIWIATPDY